MKSGRAARQKGHVGERWFVKWWKKWDCIAKTTRQAAPLEDAKGRDIHTQLPFCIQIKTGVTANPLKALLEAISAAKEQEISLGVAHNTKLKQWFVAMTLEDFEIFMELWNAQDSHGNGE